MRFLADENFEPQFVESLRDEGHEVFFLMNTKPASAMKRYWSVPSNRMPSSLQMTRTLAN